MGYLSNFIVYLFAMLGLMMLAIFIFKNCTPKINASSGKNINIIDSISIGARKNLLIVAVGNEKFLIASDADRTNLISKLDSNTISAKEITNQMTRGSNDYTTKSFSNRDLVKSSRNNTLNENYMNNRKSPYNSVMRNLADKMKG